MVAMVKEEPGVDMRGGGCWEATGRYGGGGGEQFYRGPPHPPGRPGMPTFDMDANEVLKVKLRHNNNNLGSQ